MTEIPASFHDLLMTPGIATLTTNGADGYPQSTAFWYHFDGDAIRIVMQAGTRKAKNLQRDPRCTFILIDPRDSHRVIEVRADADLTVEQGDDRPLSTMILARYGTSPDRMSNAQFARFLAVPPAKRDDRHRKAPEWRQIKMRLPCKLEFSEGLTRVCGE